MIEQRIPPTLKNSACWEFESLHPCHIQEASVERLRLFYVRYLVWVCLALIGITGLELVD